MRSKKVEARDRRHKRIRKVIVGVPAHPRLTVHRSLRNMYVQIVDDFSGKTLVGVGTQSKDFSGKKNANNCKGAKQLGLVVAKKALAKKIVNVAFDRGGFKFHGRVKAFADGAREGGLKF